VRQKKGLIFPRGRDHHKPLTRSCLGETRKKKRENQENQNKCQNHAVMLRLFLRSTSQVPRLRRFSTAAQTQVEVNAAPTFADTFPVPEVQLDGMPTIPPTNRIRKNETIFVTNRRIFEEEVRNGTVCLLCRCFVSYRICLSV
jgi:hypothetical protein